MSWKVIRLELAPNAELPLGSSVRHYLIDLPLDRSGRIDVKAARREPRRMVVRRFWPNSRDMQGYAVMAPHVLTIEFARPAAHSGMMDLGPDAVIAKNHRVRVAEPDAHVRDYVVADIS